MWIGAEMSSKGDLKQEAQAMQGVEVATVGAGSSREAAGEGLVERRFTLRNEHGLHARTATQFVQVASRFMAEIEIEKDGQRQDGKSVVGVLMLLADKGSAITVRARGGDAQAAVEAIDTLIAARFGE
jgi:phosphocarrier protein